MKKTCGVKASCRRPGAKRRIVELRTSETWVAAAAVPSYDEHVAVVKQRRRVARTCVGEAPSSGPNPTHRIVEFRTRAGAAIAKPSYDEHLAVGKQRRRVLVASV